jgi:hypothetical protein
VTVIKVPCPQCGHIASVEIATIDKLYAEIESIKRERDNYKAGLAALEAMGKTQNSIDAFMRGWGK